MSEYHRIGQVSNDGSGTTGMVYVDVRKHNVMNVLRPHTGFCQGREKAGFG
jgi:hypothetical protein